MIASNIYEKGVGFMKKIALTLIVTMSTLIAIPNIVVQASANGVQGIEKEEPGKSDNISIEIDDKGVYFNNIYYTQEEFGILLENSENLKIEQNENGRSVGALVAGTWYIPFIGKVIITAAGTVIIGGAIVKAGSWLYNKVKSWFVARAEVNSVKSKIPSSLKKEMGMLI